MEGLKSLSFLVAITATIFVTFCGISVKAQIGTPCTASMVTSFTPCINFITGSNSGNRASPTPGCCDAVKSLMSGSMDCACLIVTGNVPLSLPINQTLAITLPQACKSSIPIQCKASGVPLPAPGPVLFAPPIPPVSAIAPISPVSAVSPISPVAKAPSPLSPKASKAAAVVAAPTAETPASPPVDEVAPTAASTRPGIRPVVTQSSASYPTNIPSPFVLVIFMGIMIFKGY